MTHQLTTHEEIDPFSVVHSGPVIPSRAREYDDDGTVEQGILDEGSVVIDRDSDVPDIGSRCIGDRNEMKDDA